MAATELAVARINRTRIVVLAHCCIRAMFAEAVQRVAGVCGALVAVVAARRVEFTTMRMHVTPLVGRAQVVVVTIFVGKAAHFTWRRNALVRLQVARVVGAWVVITTITVGVATFRTRQSHMRACTRQRIT